MTVTLTPGAVDLPTLEALYRAGEPAVLDPAARTAIEKSAAVIAEAARETAT